MKIQDKESIIKRMIRARKVVKYLENYDYKNWPTGSPDTWYRGEVTRYVFVDYLMNRRQFLEDWRHGMVRVCYWVTGKWIKQGNKKYVKMLEEQRKKIDDLINFCITQKYIEQRELRSKPTSSEICLSVNWAGRRFIKTWPFDDYSFFGQTVSRFSTVRIVFVTLFGAVTMGAVGMVAVYWSVAWDSWLELLSKLF